MKKMRFLGLTLMAFFLFNGAALANETKDAALERVATIKFLAAWGEKGAVGEYAKAMEKGKPTSSSSEDSDSTVDDVTGDLMDGFF